MNPKNKTGLCRSCGMRKLNADPEFAEAHRERMRKLHADPEFAEAHRERASERMRKLHADPEFAEAHRERMRKLHADPEFAEAHRERMRKLHAERRDRFTGDLTATQLEKFQTYQSLGYSMPEARAVVLREGAAA